MRTFPGASVRGSSQTSSAVQVMTAEVAAPVSSTRGRPVLLRAPLASFQLLLGTTPATSELPMGFPMPTKSTLMTLVDELEVTARMVLVEWVSAPSVPVTVRVKLPVGVLAMVVMVSVELPEVLIDAGEKEGDAPAGKPVAVKLTVPAKPFNAATVTVYVAVPPEMMEVVEGATLRVKSGAVTLSVTLALCANSSVLVPVIASSELPPGVFVPVVTVMVELPDPIMELGKKEADAPEGRPLADKVTWPVNPYRAPTVTV
jgi:hypothetical protein